MNHKRKAGELPGWFPFAIGASLVLVIAAGSRSGWKLSGSSASVPPTPPGPPVQAGVLHGWFAVGALS